MSRPLNCTTRARWRAWLQEHSARAPEVWLVMHKKGTGRSSLSIADAQEEALCFGWIDQLSRSLDGARFLLRFTPRRPGSMWSMTNIRRVRKLTREGRMTEAGLAKVAEAKRNGQWRAAIARENTGVIPPELAGALRRRKGALAGFRALADSRKKQLLYWFQTAKTPETRQRRSEAIVREALARKP
jgi:uncharacterized protein YdeI (YjbR/CyaY-like superfamily)